MSLAIEMLLGCLFVNSTTFSAYIFLVIAIIYAVGMLFYEINNKLRIVYIILSLLCALVFFVTGAIRYNVYLGDRNYIDRIEEGDTITFQGRLAKKEKKTTSYYLYFNNIITNDQVFDSNETIILQSDSDDLPIGSTIVVDGKKEKWNVARNEGNFDEKSYYNSVGSLMKVKGTFEVMEEPLLGVGEFFYCVRENIKQAYISNLPGEEAGIISAMVLGDKSELDSDTKDLFKLSGLAHILAISGLHISIVGMSIYRLLRKRGTPFGVAGVVSFVLVILYGILTFGGVSTIRAIVMFLIMILADILGEGYDSLSAIGTSMIYVLIMYPYTVNSAGFVFSFGAVIGIAVVVNPLVSLYDRYCRMRYLYQGRNHINKVDNKVGVFYNGTFLSRFICGFKAGSSNPDGHRDGGCKRNESKIGECKASEPRNISCKASGYKTSIKERMFKALLSGVLIQLVTLPIVCIFYYEIPTYVVLLNCLVIPLLGVLLGTSLAGGIAVALGGLLLCDVFVAGTSYGSDFVSEVVFNGGIIEYLGNPLGRFVELLGEGILWISHFIVYLYEMLAYYSLQLPFSRIVTGVPDIIKVILYYLVLLLVSRYMLYKYEDMEAVFEKKENQLYNSNSMKLFERNENFAMSSNYDEKMCSGVIMSKIFYAISGFIRDKRCLIICGVMLSASVIFITSNHNYDDFEMDMVDVGQGDGIFVAGDNNYFFDGGSTDVKNVGTYRILPFLKYKGIAHIDYWFVSHVDSDHISGLIEALDAGYSISNIVVDKYMLDEDNYRDIENLANDNDVNVIVMKKGDVVAEDNLKLLCVFAGSDEIDDINGNSLGILGEYIEEDRSVRFFIGGDMTVDSEKCLLKDASAETGYCIHGEQTTGYEELSNIDILKVSHHGSKSSSCEEFLKMLSPKISLISAGVNNRYHHPSNEVIERLDELGIPHMCTQDYGRLHLYIDNSGVKVDGFLR
ncbi:MAG: ComEC/Rec2 family competence protein [Lachnospiraceae bacterium]|nr:ComEC/Rec2 family competence protein [Lachnospiraceae bacterium]